MLNINCAPVELLASMPPVQLSAARRSERETAAALSASGAAEESN